MRLGVRAARPLSLPSPSSLLEKPGFRHPVSKRELPIESRLPNHSGDCMLTYGDTQLKVRGWSKHHGLVGHTNLRQS